ncbi:DNA-binding protein, partial [Salmonella enterica]|nr:DNA-binding protein [Salmonella enterica]EKP2124476.1 DNA-binding protein [Salmonella enterica]EKP2134139.1 DNA-binding protein [Salmonella enterica]EKP2157305.1 DNA-binding protein [Salmonella enterica]
TGLSDPSCRRLIQFANLPSRQLPGVRGLCVHRESFIHAFQVLLEESVRPSGKRKRWQHPEFGGFVLRKDPKQIFAEVEA